MAADMFRLVWTKPDGGTVALAPACREEALAQFDRAEEIRRDASRGRGRLRVLRDSDYRAAGDR